MKQITISDSGCVTIDGNLTDEEKLQLAVLFGWIEDTCAAPNGMQVVLYTGIPASSSESLLLDKEMEEDVDDVFPRR